MTTPPPFYDRNAAPLTGVIPGTLRVHNQQPYDTAAVRGAVHAFYQSTRLTLAVSTHKTLRFEDGTVLSMRKYAGQHYFDVYPARRPPKELSQFYGGILIELRYLSDEARYFDTDSNPAGRVRAEGLFPSEVLTEGKTDELPGRPAAEGVLGEDPTQLIFQIKNEPFTATPVRDGQVTIWRVHEMSVGRYVEVHYDPKRYLLSMDSDGVLFYRGFPLSDVPRMPESPTTEAGSGVRIRTYGFGIKPGKSIPSGLVIVARGRQLWTCKVAGKSGVWTLLHTAVWTGDPDYVNTFGSVFTETLLPDGRFRIECSGTNGAGVCSGFVVTLTPTTSGYSAAGELLLVDDGTTPEAVSSSESGTIAMTDRATTSSLGEYETATGAALLSYVHTYSSSRSGGYQRDRFTGEMPTATAPEAFSRTYEIAAEWELVSQDIVPLPLPDTYVEFEFAGTGSVTYSETSSTKYGETTVVTASGSATAVHHFVSASGAADLGSAPSAYTSSMDPDKVRQRTSKDALETLAWEREVGQTASTGGRTFDTAFTTAKANAVFFGTPVTPVTDTTAYSYSPLSAMTRLIRRDRVARVEHPDVFALLPSTPAWAAAIGPITATYSQTIMFGDFVPGDVPAVSTATRVWPPEGSFFQGFYDAYGPSPGTVTVTGLYGMRWSPVAWAWIDSTDGRRSREGLLLWGDGPFTVTETSPGLYEYQNTSLSLSWTGSPPVFTVLGPMITAIPSSWPLGERMPLSQAINASLNTTPYIYAASAAIDPLPPKWLDQSRLTNELVEVEDWVVKDFRTGGFIANNQWAVRFAENSYKSFMRTYIGNDHSLVPLRQILDEWRALGTTSSVSDSRTLFSLITGASLV